MAKPTNNPSRTQAELLTLLVAEKSGREVADLFEDRFKRPIKFGTLYTTLGRMEEEGWIKSRDSTGQDRRVRYFRLTGTGTKVLNQIRVEHAALAQWAERAL